MCAWTLIKWIWARIWHCSRASHAWEVKDTFCTYTSKLINLICIWPKQFLNRISMRYIRINITVLVINTHFQIWISRFTNFFSQTFFQFLHTRTFPIAWFMFMKHIWVGLDVNSEKTVPYWTRSKAWSIHGNCNLSWIRAYLSFKSIIKHFNKHSRGDLRLGWACNTRFPVLLIKKVRIRSL